MLDIFTKKLRKSEKYDILYEDVKEGYLIVTTKLTFIVKNKYDQNLFQPYSHEKSMTFNVFFVLATNDEFPKFKEFRKKEIPIVLFPAKVLRSNLENITNELNKFVEIRFKK